MRIEWLVKKGAGRVVVFFNGWGMDASAVSHLGTESDVVMFYDYRTLTYRELPDLREYKEVYLVAWSMGVWAASCIVPQLKIRPSLSVALNGTERPVDDLYGIPVKIYRLTEKGMDARGREKFFSRMAVTDEEKLFLKEHLPDRKLEDQCEELVMIEKQCQGYEKTFPWNKVYVSEKDVIFPVENQLKWWKGKAPVIFLPGGHYPFTAFKNWEHILGISPTEKGKK